MPLFAIIVLPKLETEGGGGGEVNEGEWPRGQASRSKELVCHQRQADFSLIFATTMDHGVGVGFWRTIISTLAQGNIIVTI